MSKIDDLAEKYDRYISPMWQQNISGPQRTIFIVYPKEDERKFRARRYEFEVRTKESGKSYREIDLADIFTDWLATDEYQKEYFEYPEDLKMKVDSEFLNFVTERMRNILTAPEVNEDTVVAMFGVACLYGFIRLSDLLHAIETDIRGRLLVFFPGDRDGNSFRLLDARDGWNYLAVSISLHEGEPTG